MIPLQAPVTLRGFRGNIAGMNGQTGRVAQIDTLRPRPFKVMLDNPVGSWFHVWATEDQMMFDRVRVIVEMADRMVGCYMDPRCHDEARENLVQMVTALEAQTREVRECPS